MLKTKNLTKVFTTEEVETTVLNHVNAEVQQGEFVAIMGPSGCGKSTTARCLLRLLEPTSGEVWIDDDYPINDGEGLMHEDHCNSAIVDSRLVGNRVNSYLSIYKCGPIDGLHQIFNNDRIGPGPGRFDLVAAHRAAS